MDGETKTPEANSVEANEPVIGEPVTPATGVPVELTASGAVGAMNNPTLAAPKKHHKYLPAVIILAVLTCAGIGFGIFGLIMSSQSNRRSESLSSELEQKDEALKQVEEKLGAQIKIEESAKDKVEDKEEEAASVDVSAARDYIYIGDWGIKIKVSENLASVSYVFSRVQYPDILYISGATKDGQYVPSFVENSLHMGSGLIAIGRYSKDDQNILAETDPASGARRLWYGGTIAGTVIYEDDGYYFSYSHSQAAVGDESEKQWEANSADALEKMVQTGISAF